MPTSEKFHHEVQFIFEEMLEFLDEVSPSIKPLFLRLRELFAKDSLDYEEIEEIFTHTIPSGAIPSSALPELIKAFSLYNMLLNALEERHSVQADSLALEKMIAELVNEGYERERVLSVLEEICFYPVFTAHPTESRRRTFLESHHEISADLERIFSQSNAAQAKEHLRYRLMLLWQSHLVRSERIEVLFELDNLLYIIESSVLQSAVRMCADVEKCLSHALKHAPIRLGSWIGGDRDGNPYVTNEVMTRVMKLQHENIIKLYVGKIERLMRELSIASDLVKPPGALLESIERESSELGDSELKLHKNEPFRAKLILMKKKLQNRLILVNYAHSMDFVYRDCRELLADIDLLLEGLNPRSATYLREFRNLVLLSGFHLLKLDFREHRDAIRDAISEIFSLLGYSDSDFGNLPLSKRLLVLSRALERPRYDLSQLLGRISGASEEIVSAFLRIEWAKEHISPDIIDSFIISMTQDESDLLSVLWFAKQSGLYKEGNRAQISISPLFETIEDLQKAGEIMEYLARHETYGRYLKDHNNVQEIMIGYSDSSKDGGIFTSNFSLNRAVFNLTQLQKRLGITFRLFHGRGGSVSRGGGALESALMAAPAHSVAGVLKTTEQGEVISSKYLNAAICDFNFKNTLVTLLKKSVYDACDKRIDCGENDRFIELMQGISDTSYRAYRALVYESEGFMDYFKQATPIGFIQKLNIGSRPSRRKDTHRVEDLRAIPWVFAWTQNRSIIPAWFGVGSGLESVALRGEEALLKECYMQCPFFKTTLDNIAQALLKVDLEVAAFYNEFVEDKDVRERIWGVIRAEYQRTLKWILFTRGEDELLINERLLRDSILMRRPYLTALNLSQVELIKRYNATNDEAQKEQLIRQISSTIVGIAQGIRNTG